MGKLHILLIFFIFFSSCKKDKINPSGLPKKVTVTNVDDEVSYIIYFFYDNKNRLSKEVIQQPDSSIVGTYTFGYIDDQIQVKYNNASGNFTFTYIVDVQTKKILKRINTFYDKSYKYVYEYKQESQKPLTIYFFYYDSYNNLLAHLFNDFGFNAQGQCSKILSNYDHDNDININYIANKDNFGINTTLVNLSSGNRNILVTGPFYRINEFSEPLFIGLTGYTFYNSENLIDNFTFRYINDTEYKNNYQFENDKLVNYSFSIKDITIDSTILENKVAIEYN